MSYESSEHSKLKIKSINNSLHLARKYIRILILRTVFRECELRGTDNVQRQISEQAVVLLILHVLQRARKNVYEQLTVYSVGCLLLSRTTLRTKQDFSSSVTTIKPPSHLKLNLKRRATVVSVRFENRGVSFGWYLRISPSFSWRIFVNVKRQTS